LSASMDYCELCGKPITGRPIRSVVDGVEMILCIDCYLKLSKGGRARLAKAPPNVKAATGRLAQKRARIKEVYDLAEDYYERIRRAREDRGWSTATLAQKLRISESLLRKIESGKVKPSIDLAKRIEKLLKIKLLEPVIEEESYYGYDQDYVTLGDIVVIDDEER